MIARKSNKNAKILCLESWFFITVNTKIYYLLADIFNIFICGQFSFKSAMNFSSSCGTKVVTESNKL